MTHPYDSDRYARIAAGGDQIVRSETLNTWLRVRSIPGTKYLDASGLYPFAADMTPAPKASVLEELSTLKLVALVLVTDPFQNGTNLMADWDLYREYKEHFLINVRSDQNFSKHHRREINRANRRCSVRRIELADNLDEWIALYDHLVKRHGLGDEHRYTTSYFRALANDPAFSAIGAFVGPQMISCHIWAKHDQIVYSHLAASDDDGYAAGASYAIYAEAVRHFADRDTIDIGAVPDQSARSMGLYSFKRGFSNDVKNNHLCGIIVNPQVYNELCGNPSEVAPTPGYFPAYRI